MWGGLCGVVGLAGVLRFFFGSVCLVGWFLGFLFCVVFGFLGVVGLCGFGLVGLVIMLGVLRFGFFVWGFLGFCVFLWFGLGGVVLGCWSVLAGWGAVACFVLVGFLDGCALSFGWFLLGCVVFLRFCFVVWWGCFGSLLCGVGGSFGVL